MKFATTLPKQRNCRMEPNHIYENLEFIYSINLLIKQTMKRVLLFAIFMFSCVMTFAQEQEVTYPVITGLGNGEFRITINSGDQLDRPKLDLEDEKYAVLKTAKKIKIVTEDCQLMMGGMDRLCSNDFSQLESLDLSDAEVENINKNEGPQNPLTKIANAPSLKSIVFPATDGMIVPTRAFENNTKLETVVFPDNKGSYQIMNSAFKNSKIKTVSLGKGYSIPDMAYEGQWKSPTGSGESIFEHCTELTNVVLDNSITDLGVKAFSATYSIEYLILPEDLVHIGNLCFKECGIKTVTIPDNVNIGPNDQIFQGCVRLTNVYVNSDNVAVRTQGLMEMNQTFNFRYTAGDNPTYSVADYQATSVYNSSDYQDSPFVGQTYSIPVLHYPGTVTAIDNYRVPFYMHYQGVDPETGTTWPNAYDIEHKENGEVNYDPYEIVYPGYSSYWNVTGKNESEDPYAGWRQFLIGNNTFKEQKVFYDERIKESRWYSICLPINMTEAQFMSAYGVGAALKEFSGAVYDENEKMIILNFDKDAEVKDGYILQKNVPYMIHPAKIKFSKRKEIIRTADGVEFKKESVEGQEKYVTKDVIATFDTESDLFIKWDNLLNGGQALADAMAEIETNTTAALQAKSVTQPLSISASNPDNIQPADFNFKGSFMGAEIYGPGDISGNQVKLGTSPKLPVGAYYLGYDPEHGITTPQFFKSRGVATWSPYCALIENIGSSSTSGAKAFDVLDIDFNGLSDDNIVSGIGAPTIQIPVMNTDNKVYNLNGQVVRDNAKDLNGLKGIYIVGGKKVVIK